jgi:hypothetical protein
MRMHILNILFVGSVLLVAMMPSRAAAQAQNASIANLEARVSSLEQRIPVHVDQGAIAALFGAFCALWAQNTGRNAWLWFFLGAFFSVITVLVLLHKNSRDRAQRVPLTS